MTSRRAFLQELCNKFGDFKVCRMWRTPDGSTACTKHRSVLECWHTDEGLEFLDNVNNRQILWCELVLDIETKEQIKPVLNVLKKINRGSDIKVFQTGSRGWHVHCWLTQLNNILLLQGKSPAERNKLKTFILKKYLPEADILKASENVMIALENVPHWKTGKIKIQLKTRSQWS